jgi:hypothetical protein
MGIGKALLREKTLPRLKGTTTFYAPSVYVPIYGKTKHTVGGRGVPGGAPTGGNVSGTNPPTGGNLSYNAPTGGNYAGTNPTVYGNYAGTNPPTPGNYLGTNPPTPGNVAYNPVVPGTLAGTNPTTYVYSAMDSTSYYDNHQDAPIYANTSYSSYQASGPYGRPYSANYTQSTTPNSYYVSSSGASTGMTGNSVPAPSYSSNTSGGSYYTRSVNYNTVSTTPGNPYYNPPSGGTQYYNGQTLGNPYYNPPTTGNPYYNPPTYGNPYYNAIVNGNSYYNAVIPGNPNYNAIIPGPVGAPTTVLGVLFPGGASGTAAPLVAPVPVTINYDPAGVSITVPAGGYVDVTNS